MMLHGCYKFRSSTGFIIGGALNSIVSFPESMLLFAELLLAEVLLHMHALENNYTFYLQVFLLTGVTVIDQLCPQRSRMT